MDWVIIVEVSTEAEQSSSHVHMVCSDNVLLAPNQEPPIARNKVVRFSPSRKGALKYGIVLFKCKKSQYDWAKAEFEAAKNLRRQTKARNRICDHPSGWLHGNLETSALPSQRYEGPETAHFFIWSASEDASHDRNLWNYLPHVTSIFAPCLYGKNLYPRKKDSQEAANALKDLFDYLSRKESFFRKQEFWQESFRISQFVKPTAPVDISTPEGRTGEITPPYVSPTLNIHTEDSEDETSNFLARNFEEEYEKTIQNKDCRMFDEMSETSRAVHNLQLEEIGLMTDYGIQGQCTTDRTAASVNSEVAASSSISCLGNVQRQNRLSGSSSSTESMEEVQMAHTSKRLPQNISSSESTSSSSTSSSSSQSSAESQDHRNNSLISTLKRIKSAGTDTLRAIKSRAKLPHSNREAIEAVSSRRRLIKTKITSQMEREAESRKSAAQSSSDAVGNENKFETVFGISLKYCTPGEDSINLGGKLYIARKNLGKLISSMQKTDRSKHPELKFCNVLCFLIRLSPDMNDFPWTTPAKNMDKNVRKRQDEIKSSVVEDIHKNLCKIKTDLLRLGIKYSSLKEAKTATRLMINNTRKVYCDEPRPSIATSYRVKYTEMSTLLRVSYDAEHLV